MSRDSFGAANTYNDVGGGGPVRNGSSEEGVKGIDNTVNNFFLTKHGNKNYTLLETQS